jgi:hypothetical protein
VGGWYVLDPCAAEDEEVASSVTVLLAVAVVGLAEGGDLLRRLDVAA